MTERWEIAGVAYSGGSFSDGFALDLATLHVPQAVKLRVHHDKRCHYGYGKLRLCGDELWCDAWIELDDDDPDDCAVLREFGELWSFSVEYFPAREDQNRRPPHTYRGARIAAVSLCTHPKDPFAVVYRKRRIQ